MALAPAVWGVKEIGGLISNQTVAYYDDALSLAVKSREPSLILLGNELVATWSPEGGERVINKKLRGRPT
jgi:hypothetical protein